MSFLFILDRTNYARWLSVHIHDMVHLSTNHPAIFEEFQSGKFTVHKTLRRFSAIALDHAQEQLNADVKGDGGAVGQTENESALSRWVIAGPEVARVINEFKSSLPPMQTLDTHHYEEQSSIQLSFVQSVSQLVNTIVEMGNPFQDQADLVVLHNRNVMTHEAAQSVCKVYDIGQSQYKEFVKQRLVERSVSLHQPLKRNKLSLCVAEKAVTKS